MEAEKTEKGHYITCIGTLNSEDQFLLDLLIDNGFLLERCVMPSYTSYSNDKKMMKQHISYRIYMEDDE